MRWGRQGGQSWETESSAILSCCTLMGGIARPALATFFPRVPAPRGERCFSVGVPVPEFWMRCGACGVGSDPELEVQERPSSRLRDTHAPNWHVQRPTCIRNPRKPHPTVLYPTFLLPSATCLVLATPSWLGRTASISSFFGRAGK